jgi:hypothetical protein
MSITIQPGCVQMHNYKGNPPPKIHLFVIQSDGIKPVGTFTLKKRTHEVAKEILAPQNANLNQPLPAIKKAKKEKPNERALQAAAILATNFESKKLPQNLR